MSVSVAGHEDGRTKSTLHLRIPPDPVFARTVRDAIVGFGKLHGVGERELASMLFAVGEALANAIEHSACSDDIEVHTQLDDRQIVTTVIDHGHGFPRPPDPEQPLPEGLIERGRGIGIMRQCTDFFELDSNPATGTAITLGLRRPPKNTEPLSAS
jgi:serine/threonine-protein kinase RsbW